MDKKLLDTYTDYLIAQNQNAITIGLSNFLNGQINHDKITRFLNSKKLYAKN